MGSPYPRDEDLHGRSGVAFPHAPRRGNATSLALGYGFDTSLDSPETKPESLNLSPEESDKPFFLTSV